MYKTGAVVCSIRVKWLIALAFMVVAACDTSGEPVLTTAAAIPSTTALPSTTATQTTTPTTTLPPLRGLAYEEVADLPFPIDMVADHDAGVTYVATKGGHIHLFDGERVSGDPALDLSGVTVSSGERGLLGMAIHPDDPTRLYVHYSARNGDTVVSEHFIGDDADEARELLRLGQPADNHNGGMLQFGPDGALYLGLGDGGGSGDRFGNGQNTDSLLGGLVRLQPEGEPDPTLVAYGLRNPWRFWIEDTTIYIADVGQGAYEEVNVAPLEPGHNFGWPITEGLHCFQPPQGCQTEGLTLPLVEVAHGDAGTCSITGGVVYRGEAIPEVDGHYFYSDYCGGYLRSFRHDNGEVVDESDWTDGAGIAGPVVSFGVDASGEMYVMTTDALLKVVAVR